VAAITAQASAPASERVPGGAGGGAAKVLLGRLKTLRGMEFEGVFEVMAEWGGVAAD
jgi:hypothetical protein